MTTKEQLLTAKQLKAAKEIQAELVTLWSKIQFLGKIEDHDGHTNGLAYDAAQSVLELGDAIFGLQDRIREIENFSK